MSNEWHNGLKLILEQAVKWNKMMEYKRNSCVVNGIASAVWQKILKNSDNQSLEYKFERIKTGGRKSVEFNGDNDLFFR